MSRLIVWFLRWPPTNRFIGNEPVFYVFPSRSEIARTSGRTCSHSDAIFGPLNQDLAIIVNADDRPVVGSIGHSVHRPSSRLSTAIGHAPNGSIPSGPPDRDDPIQHPQPRSQSDV